MAKVCLLVLATAATARAQSVEAPGETAADQATPAAGQAAPPPGGQVANLVTCSSLIGQRIQCSVDTSAGVALVRSRGAAPCLFGDSWGFDAAGIWVADGCSGVFLLGRVAQVQATTEVKQSAPSYVPNAGFLLFDGEKGQIYFRLMTYARYLNQRNLDETYVDAFGNTKSVQRRQDMQLAKFFAPFSGWFLDPRFRYYLYVWSSNASQGDPAQVVGAGNISWTWNRFATAGFGIASLPSVRSTEGQFPYWLGVDDRLIADEFFRGSYTTGAWLKGEIAKNVKYNAMFANNLSTLGVSAAQLDNKFDTQSFALTWLPTTGEFGLFGTFGDYDDHQKVATRVGWHYTHSTEDKTVSTRHRTPLAWALLDRPKAVLLLWLIWSGAILGVLFRLLWTTRPAGCTCPIYIALGCGSLFYLPDFFAASVAAAVLICVGGALYIAGAVFYALKKPNFSYQHFGFHELFHAFTVLAFARPFHRRSPSLSSAELGPPGSLPDVPPAYGTKSVAIAASRSRTARDPPAAHRPCPAQEDQRRPSGGAGLPRSSGTRPQSAAAPAVVLHATTSPGLATAAVPGAAPPAAGPSGPTTAASTGPARAACAVASSQPATRGARVASGGSSDQDVAGHGAVSAEPERAA